MGTFEHFLMRANDVLTASVSATAFALFLYLVFYNRKSEVARAFGGLLGCVIVVYAGDLLLTNLSDSHRAGLLLRMQWMGIAFTPLFYVELIRSIRASVMRDQLPPWLFWLAFVLCSGIAGLALTTDWVVSNSTTSQSVVYLRPGVLFYPFAVCFALVTLWGVRETLVARHRCYTRTARRRMAYLSLSFVAPALGVFPYLLLTGWPSALPGTLLWVLLIFGNVAVAVMLALMAYSVAFFGALAPERVIKHRLVRFLLRGPFSALLGLVAFGVGLTVEPLLGLGPYTLSLVACATAVILTQLGVELAKPLIDLALYREGAAEVAQVQELGQRLLTTADLRQFLENVLAAICEALHSSVGFLAILEDGKPRWEVWCDLHMSSDELAALPLTSVVKAQPDGMYVVWDGYWVMTVRDKSGNELLGLVGVRQPETAVPLSSYQESLLSQLLLQASAALEDRRLQQVVFSAFSPLLSELTDIQRRGGVLRYEGEVVTGFAPNESADLPHWVHDALAHYWGGPRLTENPLLEFEVVKRAAEEHDGNTVKGLRDVLDSAIERLRPAGERKLTAPEWLLYNIVEMKFLRGQKVRQVALNLAVSESDFYRKQRIALENLAAIIAEMEAQMRQD